MAEYKNPFKKSAAVEEMTQKIVQDIQVRERTAQEIKPDESHLKNIEIIERAKEDIKRSETKTVSFGIKISAAICQRLDRIVYKKALDNTSSKKPMKRNGFIELAIEEYLKREEPLNA